MKIGIVGPTGSGKTCYFVGMLREMLSEKSGYSIKISDPKASGELIDKILNLADTSLSAQKRWPDPNDHEEEYTLELLDGGSKCTDILWIDCPSDRHSMDQSRLAERLGSVDCLFVCVDGSLLQGDPEELEDIAYDFYNESGMDLCNALMRAEQKSGEAFPPVCILITKYDAVSPELQNMNMTAKFLKACFPVLFSEGKGKNRMVTICPVSLGKDIAEGGKLRPKNVECPICFAAFLSQYVTVQETVKKYKDVLEMGDKLAKAYNEKSFFGKLITPKPRVLSEEEKKVVIDLINTAEDDLKGLLSMVKDLPLYINGKEANWPD